MPKRLHYDAGRRLAAKALANGARRTSLLRIEWDLSGDCQAPRVFEVYAAPEANDGKWLVVAPGRAHPLLIVMETRCRCCDPCREMRRRLWAARAQSETRSAIRTWFGTMTLTADQQFRFLAMARRELGRQGIDYDALSFKEQFTERHRQISPEITKWLKRVRKQSQAPMRYLLVAEQHRSGNPHYHCLVHERSMLNPVRERVLHGQWLLGFSRWKLIEDLRQATYLCKYLSKSAAARVRASQRYGQEDALSGIAELISEMRSMKSVGKNPSKGDGTIDPQGQIGRQTVVGPL